MDILPTRTPWTPDFPDVFVHSDMRARNKHVDYQAAKSGNAEAAIALAEALISAEETDKLGQYLAGRSPMLLAVTADEVGGFNAVPDAIAHVLAYRLNWAVSAGAIVQANLVGHTKADGWHRLVTPAAFAGDTVAGVDYVLVDDHVGFGGTLANLRGFIEARGGQVLAMTTLTETREARRIAVRPETLNMLQEKHGTELERFWRAAIGHEVASLTDIEAGYLCRVESVAAIKNRMAQAAELARGRGLSTAGGSHEP